MAAANANPQRSITRLAVKVVASSPVPVRGTAVARRESLDPGAVGLEEMLMSHASSAATAPWGRCGSLVVALTLLLAGCAQSQLRPAADAELVPGLELAAVTENAGVRMVVQAAAWEARPESLERELTPLKVTIENHGNQPVRVRYEDFAIETGQGIRYMPLPPLQIRGTATERADVPVRVPAYVITPRFTYRGFYVAPWYAPYYTRLRPWAHPWPFSPIYYDTYYPRWTVKLPTPDMLELAIPEGVIEPGGTVSGFLYFPEIEGDLGRVTFRAELMEGRNGNRLGALELPFEVG